MLKQTILLVVLFTVKVHCDAVEDAEDKLNELRLVISDSITDAFKQHIAMSMQIDALAFETKSAGEETLKAAREKLASLASCKTENIQKEALEARLQASSDDLNACVEKHASGAIDYIFSSSMDMTSKILKLSYEEEKNLVLCEASDEACIKDVIDNLNMEIDGIPDTVQDGLSADKDEVDMHMSMLAECGSAAKAKAAFAKKITARAVTKCVIGV